MKWLEELKEFVECYDNCDDHSLTFGMETIDKHTLRRLISIADRRFIQVRDWKYCTGCGSAIGHGVKNPEAACEPDCPYSDKWVKQ